MRRSWQKRWNSQERAFCISSTQEQAIATRPYIPPTHQGIIKSDQSGQIRDVTDQEADDPIVVEKMVPIACLTTDDLDSHCMVKPPRRLAEYGITARPSGPDLPGTVLAFDFGAFVKSFGTEDCAHFEIADAR